MRPVPLPESRIWPHAERALSDPIFAKLRGKLPALQVMASTPEGTAYPTALMDEMGQILTGYEGPALPYPDEETVLPSLAAQLTSIHGLPFVYSEVTAEKPLDIETIELVRTGKLPTMTKHFYGDPVDRQVYDSTNLYAVKRIPREIDHPLRTYVRGLPS